MSNLKTTQYFNITQRLKNFIEALYLLIVLFLISLLFKKTHFFIILKCEHILFVPVIQISFIALHGRRLSR